MMGLFGSFKEEEVIKIIQEGRMLSKSGNVPLGSSPGHMDGYGVSVFRNDKWGDVDRGTGAATDSTTLIPNVKKATEKEFSALLFHMRKASPHIGKVYLENTHPFLRHNCQWAFQHNGSIFGWQGLPTGDYTSTSKESDSEAFFRFLLTRINSKGGSTIAEIIKLAYEETQTFIESATSFTSILSSGEQSFVVRSFTKNEKYLTLFVRSEKNRAVVASEPLRSFGPENSWKLIPNKTLLHISFEKGYHEPVQYNLAL
ncbi:MAG TPA: class II glutamine amidotransferase [Candidatus Hodarchaeales archaeon]|nr:class II glutamine amidotransferase [Candidatus Hodarchaeales archaeon]